MVAEKTKRNFFISFTKKPIKFSDSPATTKGFPSAKYRHGRKKRVRFGLAEENKMGLLYSAFVILIHSAMEKRD